MSRDPLISQFINRTIEILELKTTAKRVSCRKWHHCSRVPAFDIYQRKAYIYIQPINRCNCDVWQRTNIVKKAVREQLLKYRDILGQCDVSTDYLDPSKATKNNPCPVPRLRIHISWLR